MDVRLEEAFVWEPDKRIDIVLHYGKDIIPIELKYCTKEADIDSTGGVILKNQGAEDIRRYDFIKDVQRIETIRKECSRARYRFVCGFAVLLTNSHLFWKKRDCGRCCDRAFRIHEGRRIGGEMRWADNTSAGTMKGREAVLETDQYEIVWNRFKEEPDFRYTAIRVDSRGS